MGGKKDGKKGKKGKSDLAEELGEGDGERSLSHDTDADGNRSHYSNTNRYDGDGKEEGHQDDGHAARHLNTKNKKKGRGWKR